jgi:tripartite-type tricarboxylate transporter receptor subunit TctC
LITARSNIHQAASSPAAMTSTSFASGLARCAAAMLVSLAAIGSATAQSTWPVKAVKFVLPVPPGSFTDLAARAVAAELADQLAQPFVVENRPGGGATIGADYVAKSPADGYTFLVTENGFTIAPALHSKLPYDPLRDFVHVTLIAEAPTVWVARLEFEPRTVRELVDRARARPGEITVASAGQGTSSHLAAELFLSQQGVKMLSVPFKGVAPAYAELVAGRVDLAVSSIASPMSHIRAGRARALAVTGRERSPLLPDVPTFAEAGFPQYDMPIWFGIVGPAGLPQPVIARLSQEVARALDKPKVRDMFLAQGARPTTLAPADFTRRIESEIRQWRDLVPKAGIKPEN